MAQNNPYPGDSLQRLQAVELDILRAIRDVCEAHGITYFLDGGTTLGAVRHGGFIPWDDDADVAMPQEDYEHFLRVAPEALPEGYTLTESLKYGAVEVAIFISTVISWLLSLVIGGDLIFAIVLAGIFAVGGEYRKQRIFFARSKKESRRRTGPFFLCALAAAILVFIVKLIMMLEGM